MVDRLRSIKNIFLLNQSDYLTHFLDNAILELMKPTTEMSVDKVQALFDFTIQSPSSVSSSDPFKECFFVEQSPFSLFEQLMKINSIVGVDVKKYQESFFAGRHVNINETLSTGIAAPASDVTSLTGMDTFMVGYNVGFPLSLVLSKKVITKYQIIFRNLIQCKFLERMLGSTWLEGAKLQGKLDKRATAGLFTQDEQERSILSKLSLLRSKMLHFIQQITYYMFFEVIEPQWARFEAHLSCVSTVDDLLEKHEDFLNSCLKESMLTDPKLIVVLNVDIDVWRYPGNLPFLCRTY